MQGKLEPERPWTHGVSEYHKPTAERSWRAMQSFFDVVFEEDGISWRRRLSPHTNHRGL
jgi:hypothetical protein